MYEIGKAEIDAITKTKVHERVLMYHNAGAFTRRCTVSVKEPFFPGVNYRVSEIQGAIMGEQLKRLDKIMTKKEVRNYEKLIV